MNTKELIQEAISYLESVLRDDITENDFIRLNAIISLLKTLDLQK